MTTQQAKDPMQIAQDIIEAFNADDWTRFKAPLAANVVYEEIGTARRVQGADAYVQTTKEWKQAFPDAKGMIRNSISSGSAVVQEVLWEGTQTGALQTPGGTLPASGRRVMVPAMIWLTFEGDQIQEVHHHIDVMGMMQQLGVMSNPSGG
ncbi:MAG TPA: ester cyclase [Roseiflexaceae bacterium]|nr:ester cyclase [Roseiflexaceae bacterium]